MLMARMVFRITYPGPAKDSLSFPIMTANIGNSAAPKTLHLEKEKMKNGKRGKRNRVKSQIRDCIRDLLRSATFMGRKQLASRKLVVPQRRDRKRTKGQTRANRGNRLLKEKK